jgi:oxaloacetate decarboxylase alpha subunit
MKAIDSDVDVIDTSISSMSMTYGHSPTETIAAIVAGTPRDAGLNIEKMAEVAAYFRDVREKYAEFEGSLKGVDARILTAQVPGGMLTNMENQLKEQGAADKFDEVLTEIPKVRKDLGYIPLVTPTSQIVGTQSVLNVLTGERYKTITKETEGVLKGKYGSTAAPVDAELQARVLDGKEAITCRPADLLAPEVDKLSDELQVLAKEKNITLADEAIDDVLTYALFPQIGLKFLENRNNPSAFEPIPTKANPAANVPNDKSTNPVAENYAVSVDGKVYDVVVAPGGSIESITHPAGDDAMKQSASISAEETLNAPLAGNIFKVLVQEGDNVEAGDVVIIMEAMKMETEIRAVTSGEIVSLFTKEGDSVAVGDALLSFS